MLVSRLHAPVRQQTLRNLRNAIINGRFKPGERLVERELCQLTGVSRTSIREALRQLETEGLIRLVPNKGPCVAVVTLEEAKDIYEVRQVLEGLACRLFAERASSSELIALGLAVKRLEEACHEGTASDLVTRKDEFYDVLLQGCGNNLVDSILKSLNARISLLRKISLSEPGRPLESLKEIERILEAIERRDPDAAWTAIIGHIQKAEAVATEVLRRGQNEKPDSQDESLVYSQQKADLRKRKTM